MIFHFNIGIAIAVSRNACRGFSITCLGVDSAGIMTRLAMIMLCYKMGASTERTRVRKKRTTVYSEGT